jgi:protein gp37
MENSKISWCDHSQNFWIGCHKVTDGCKFCYAEAFNDRYKFAVWGNNGTRHITSETVWNNPIKWNKKAGELGIRYRVFCSSLSDIMEDRDELNEPRERIWKIIEETPNLDWLLLTKRPENFKKFFPERWLTSTDLQTPSFPRNIWLGTTIVTQKDYDTMFPHIQDFCSNNFVKVMFVSCEPLVGAVNFNTNVTDDTRIVDGNKVYQAPLSWIIIGGESGHITKIRKMQLEHVKGIISKFEYSRSIVGMPKIFFKQLGSILGKQYNLPNVKGENFEEYPHHLEWLKIREFPI